MTHTFVELEVSATVYREISKKLLEAGYDHAFIPARTQIGRVQEERETRIDMHGIALVMES